MNLRTWMMEEHVKLAPGVADTSDRRMRIGTVRLPDMRRDMVDVHRRKRGAKRSPTRVVENDGRWRAAPERSRDVRPETS